MFFPATLNVSRCVDCHVPQKPATGDSPAERAAP